MKIALVHNLKAGGQKRVLFEEIKRLSKDHTVDVFTLSSAEESTWSLQSFAHKFSSYHYDIPYHFPQSVISIYTKLKSVYKQIAEDIDSSGYDVVYVNPDFLTQTPFILLYLKTPTLYHAAEPKREFYESIPRHTKIINYWITYPFRLPIKFIDSLCARKAKKVMVNSQFSKNRVDFAYGCNSVVNYLGVDTEIFNIHNIKKKNTVLSVGSLSLLKGHDFVIKSLSEIDKKNRPSLTIIGQGGIEKDYLLNLSKELEVNTLVYESVTDEQLIRFYNESLAYIFAPIAEPFGLTVLEAAACGLPIIATNDGAVLELMKTIPNLHIVSRNTKLFSKAISDCLNQKEKNKFITKGDLAKKWSWDVHTERLINLFRETIQ